MIPAIQARFTDKILEQLAARFGVAPDQLKNLGGFESYVYEFERHSRPLILKITHTIRRSPSYILGELEWLNFLAEHEVSVSRPIPSLNGQWVEVLAEEDGHCFLAMAYEKAPGKRVAPEDWNGELFEKWGRLIGKMHAVTKKYRVSDPAYKRQEWYQEEHLNLRKYLPAEQSLVIERGEALMERLRELPTDRDAYGLVHTDLHNGNFHLENGVLTAFDFDDCGYNWFVNDIAISMYYAIQFPRKPYADKAVFAEEFLRSFLRGYQKENELAAHWIQKIPDFLMLRHLLMHCVFHQVSDPSVFTEEERTMLARQRGEIEEGIPLVDLDFAAFAATV